MKVDILCTAFRDGFQSVYGARVLSKDFLPIVSLAKKAGIKRFESGGGAAFQSAFFYLNENAFDVMDAFRQAAGKDAYLQTLARGINVVGLESQSSDIIRLHAQLFKKHGVTAIRNFDALNDPDNLAFSGQCIVDAGLEHQLAIAMMSLPPGSQGAHDPDFYENTLKKILKAKIPFHSLAFKDASGTSVPSVVYETIRRARKLVGKNVPIEFHSHETGGTGLACYLAALNAGANIVDVSLAPVSGGTCQPDLATLWHALRGTEFELDVDIDAVMEVEEEFKEAMKPYFLPPEAVRVEPKIPWSPMPGGALTANTQMLRDNNLMDKYAEMIAAMEEVVRKGGYGTSVTPVSQFYFQQAFNNVVVGPWKKMAEGYGKMVLGYFGKTPVAPDPQVVKLASEQLGLPPTNKSPRLLNDADPKKGVAAATARLKEQKLPVTDENIFIVAACGDKGLAFLRGEGKVAVRYAQSQEAPRGPINVVLDGTSYEVKVEAGQVVVNGKTLAYQVSEGQGSASATSATTPTASAQDLTAPMAGTVTKVLVKEGEKVAAGQALLILEVMKMENTISATQAGTIQKIEAGEGTRVAAGQTLIRFA